MAIEYTPSATSCICNLRQSRNIKRRGKRAKATQKTKTKLIAGQKSRLLSLQMDVLIGNSVLWNASTDGSKEDRALKTTVALA